MCLYIGTFCRFFLGVVNAFGNGISYFIGFAEAETYGAFAITYHYDSGEAEAATTFHNFRHAVDSYDFLFQVRITGTRLFFAITIVAGSAATVAAAVITTTVIAATVITTLGSALAAGINFCHDSKFLEIKAAFAGSFCQ